MCVHACMQHARCAHAPPAPRSPANLGLLPALPFLCREVNNYAFYLVELALVDYPSLKFSYSMLAAAALYTARLALGRENPFCSQLQHHSGYTAASVQECAVHLAGLFRKAPSASLQAVMKKYSSDKFGAVAKLPAPAALLDDDA